MRTDSMIATARALAAPGKGILAADESTPTMAQRLAAVGVESTANLDALNRCGPQPWELSFSFGRALQAPVLRAWAGDDARCDAAQAALAHRAAMNGAARRGGYRPDLERIPAAPAGVGS